MQNVIVILDNIRSAHNVGSVFRTSEGVGVQKIYLVGYTPTPIDRFGRTQSEIQKTSLGASEMVPWEHITEESVTTLCQQLQADSYELVAVEQTKQSVDFRTYTPESKTAFIFGNEVDGVSKDFLNAADIHIELPMAGEKESLNVSVTVGATLYRYR